MTWEWALIIVVTICCVYSLTDEWLKRFIAPKQDFPFTADEFVALKDEVTKLKDEHQSVVKLAEDTKKMISETNLALGFRPRGQR